MAAPVYRIDGSGLALLKGTLHRPAVSVRRSVVQRPGLHGVVPAGGVVFDEPTVRLRVFVESPTAAAFEVAVAALMARLARPGDITLTRIAGGVETAAIARLVGVSEPVYYPDRAADHTITLAIPGVFFRDPAPISTAALAAQANVVAAPLTALAGGSGPISDAVVRVAGPCTQVSVSDPASGTGLSWSGALAAGSYLYLDAASLSARISTSASAWDSGGTVVTGGLDYPGAGPLQLWPQPAISVTGVGRASTTTVMVRARRAFL